MSNEKTHMELSDRIKIVRKEWGFSQKQMAERLGIGVSTYQYYERNEREIPAKLLTALTTYGVDPTWLLLGSGIFPKNNDETIKNSGEVVDYQNIVESEHRNLIKRFRNKEKAKEMNEQLIELEEISEILFEDVGTYLKATLNSAKKLKESDQKKTNETESWTGQDRRKNKAG